ncbi:MAG: hypothetical protein IKF14_13215 [Atopobiaceae bacterium]|nr:hypothetical protein [Atopobiaceae bacterium]
MKKHVTFSKKNIENIVYNVLKKGGRVRIDSEHGDVAVFISTNHGWTATLPYVVVYGNSKKEPDILEKVRSGGVLLSKMRLPFNEGELVYIYVDKQYCEWRETAIHGIRMLDLPIR